MLIEVLPLAYDSMSLWWSSADTKCTAKNAHLSGCQGQLSRTDGHGKTQEGAALVFCHFLSAERRDDLPAKESGLNLEHLNC